MPNLRYFLILAGGFAIGFAAAKLSAPPAPPTFADSSDPTSVTAPSFRSSSDQRPLVETPDGKDIFPTTNPTKCPEAPVCPCLFSDKILPAPEFTRDLKATLESNFEGEVLVKWSPINGAKRYEVRLESETGEALKTYKTPRTILYLKDIPLPPGKFEADYILRLVSVNGKDQPGPKGPARALHVKPQASVVAPQVQEIRVED